MFDGNLILLPAHLSLFSVEYTNKNKINKTKILHVRRLTISFCSYCSYDLLLLVAAVTTTATIFFCCT